MNDRTRQYAPTIDGIRRDHVQRYLFSANVIDRNKVLDLACGCGYGSQLLHDAGYEVTAGDICQEAIDFANLHYPGPEYKLMDCSNPPRERFDSVVSFETIEHLKDPVGFLTRINCGMLMCSVPNQEVIPFDPVKFKDDEYPHQRHYTPKEFEELLNQAGFIVKEKWSQKDKQGFIRQGTDGMFLIYICDGR